MSNHLSPTSVSDHSSYIGNSGVSPSLSHRSIATTISSSSSPSPSAKMTSQDSDAGEFGRPKPITCRWDNCGRVYYDPEVVYKHLCDDHVGRKSTNNLCLTCRWEGCDVSCAKRDHITSHLRVHTPLKPHSCDICNKTFKRPQDLKKHERIHTDQHQQERQHKAAQNAAARTYSLSSESSAFGSYHLAAAAGAPTSYGYAGYPPHPAMYQHAGEAAYPLAYPALPAHQHMREHTPGYAQSNASLSPLSSRLDTPQGSSPAALASYPNTRDSYLNFTSGPDARQKATSDPNSYMFLAHGAGHASSGNLAGTKRNHEQVGEFFGDVRRKRIAPNYDAHMAERLNQTFGSTGIDDASLQALLSTFEAPSASAGMAQSHSQPSSTLHTPESNMSVSSQQPSRLALPDAMKPSDLAQLNAFLLQLGANAARDLPASTAPPTSTFGATSSTAALSDFDINSLNQYGLTSIPGFDESLFSGHQDTTQLGYQQAHMHRPIAQLPHRQHQPQSFGAATYSSNSLPHDMSGMAPHGSMYTHAPQQATFDSMRVSWGPAIVPQLAPMDMGGHSFRKVEALTRAAPGPTTTSVQLDRSSEVRTKESREDTMQDDDDDEMHGADLSREPSSSGSIFRDRYRSSSPTASSEGDASTTTEGVERYGSASPGLGLYPRLGSNDALRRLPSFRSSTSPSSSSSSPRRGLSISSMLSNEPGGSDSPSSSRRLPPIRQDSTSSEASGSMYPSLADQVSKIKGLGRPATVPDALRHRHVRLIRELLIAINFPEKAAAAVRSREGANDDERITLPPILTHADKRIDYEEGERTPLSAPHGAGVAGSLPPLPPRTDSSNSSGEGSDGSGSSAATPPGRAKLPTISQLLNDVNVDVDVHRLPRGMDEREMECDV